MNNNNVKFIRKNGRIIPIKVKEGTGSRGGKYKLEPNNKEKLGKNIAKVGIFGIFASPLIATLYPRPKPHSTIKGLNGQKQSFYSIDDFKSKTLTEVEGQLNELSKKFIKDEDLFRQKFGNNVINLQNRKIFKDKIKQYNSIASMNLRNKIKKPKVVAGLVALSGIATLLAGAGIARREMNQRIELTRQYNKQQGR